MSQKDNIPPIPDASPRNWVERFVPSPLKPFAQLMRLDRPIGSWLLLMPCLWGVALARAEAHLYPPLNIVALFIVGSIIMRGAGCTLNDIIDRDIDAQIQRTKHRPLAAGTISLKAAAWFLCLQLALGGMILLQFNPPTIWLGIAALIPVAIYPFMKRISSWPQLFLGITFNWGAMLGYMSITGSLNAQSLLLYCAGIFWTLGYDTIYAHQDRNDDTRIGVKSSARALGHNSRAAIIIFYTLTILALALAGIVAQLGALFLWGVAIGGYHLFQQIYRLDVDNPKNCLTIFKSNRDFGIIVFCAILLGVF